MEATTITTCKNCGHQFSGKYCNACGEKRFNPDDKRVGHLLHESFHFLTHFEGSFFRTLKAVFTRPGQLSADYCEGIRKRYFKPISFFLFSVILYLLFSTYEGLNMRFANYLNKQQGLRSVTLQPARQKLKALGITGNELAARYDAKSPKVAKVLLFILIPLCALVFYGLSFWKRRYYFDHFVFATEAMAIYVLGTFVLLYFLNFLVVKLYPPGDRWFANSSWVWLSMRIGLVVWVWAGMVRFYKDKWYIALLKALVFGWVFHGYIRFIYAIVLYFTVLLLV